MSSPNVIPVDLTNCDREPIHIPGSIQPHGAMLVCDPTADLPCVGQCGALLGCDWRSCRPLAVGPARSAGGARSAQRGEQDGRLAHCGRAAQPIAARRRPAARHLDPQSQGPDVRRVRAQRAGEGSGPSAIDLTQSLIRRISLESDVTAIAATGAKLARTMLGYDRVMVYQFLHNGAGRVIAEAQAERSAELHGPAFSRRRHPLPGAAALSAQSDPGDLGRKLHAGAGAAPGRRQRRADRHVVRGAAQRLADPLRISAEHGRRGDDVDVDRRQRRVVGPDRLPSRQRRRSYRCRADRRRAVRAIFLAADRGRRTPRRECSPPPPRARS